jgi:tetratricopeptide (TPR) repeat protein
MRAGWIPLATAIALTAGRALALVHAQVASVPVQETPLPRDPRLLETIDGELPFAGILDERSAGITQALRTRDYERAETLLLQAAEAHPGSAEVLRTLGGVFFLRGRPLNAAIAFKKAEAIAPLDERSRFTLVMAYVAVGRRDWARPELAKLAAAAPANPLYPYWTARLDQDDGRYAAAVEGLQRATQLDSRYMRAYDNLGLCYEALGRFDEAERSFGEALRLNRGEKTRSPWPALNLGLLLTRLDRPDAAEARFRESRAADPRLRRARYPARRHAGEAGPVAEALTEPEEAARLDPRLRGSRSTRWRASRRRSGDRRADRALERFLRSRRSRTARRTRPRRTNARRANDRSLSCEHTGHGSIGPFLKQCLTGFKNGPGQIRMKIFLRYIQ